MNSKTDWHALGIGLVEETQGEEAAKHIRRSPAEIRPGFADYAVEAGTADGCGRDGLALGIAAEARS